MGNGSLSKLWSLTLPFNCYETGHTWTPYCSEAWADVFTSGFQSCFPLYTALNLTTQLLTGRTSLDAFQRTLHSSVRSSATISYCLFFCGFFMCMSRRYFGRFTIPMVFASGTAGCYLGMLLENPKRNRPLLIYMLNLASEVLFNVLQENDIFQGIKHGETLLFATSLATFLYLSRKFYPHRDPLTTALRYALGKQELLPNSKTNEATQCKDSNANCYCPSSQIAQQPLQQKTVCQHPHSCHRHIAQTFLKFFLLGAGGSVALRLLTSIPLIARNPRTVMALLRKTDSTRVGLFLSTFTGIYTLSACLLRYIFQKHEPWHSIPCSLAASSSLLLWPSKRLALYVMWKSIEALYFVGVNNKMLPSYDSAPAVLFALSCGTLLVAGLLKPHLIRPSYMLFIDKILGNRFHFFNTSAIDVLGYKTSQFYPEDIPLLNPKYLTRQYTERFWVWSYF